MAIRALFTASARRGPKAKHCTLWTYRPMKGPWSQRAAIAFCAAVSIVGWIVIAFLFSILTPDQTSRTVTEGKAGPSMDIAPASGPNKKQGD